MEYQEFIFKKNDLSRRCRKNKKTLDLDNDERNANNFSDRLEMLSVIKGQKKDIKN